MKILVKYQTYSPLLKRSFINHKVVDNLDDFKLFARALFSGNWHIISTEEIESKKCE